MTSVEEIPDLWGSEIDIKVVPPLVILKTQAEAISKRTQGMIQAKVETRFQPKAGNVDSLETEHRFELHAPSITYTELLFSVSHDYGKAYPASVRFLLEDRYCPTQSHFIENLTQVLRSNHVRIVLDNILAMIYEANMK